MSDIIIRIKITIKILSGIGTEIGIIIDICYVDLEYNKALYYD